MLETDRLIVRKFLPTDGEDLHEYLSLEETFIYEPGRVITREEAKELAAQRAGSDSFYAVVLKSNGKMIGHLYFHHQDPKEFMTWELGYIFHPQFQGHGYCTEASKRILEYGFTVLRAHRISAFCNPKNTPSWKVLEKLGMEKEGYFRKKAFFRRDQDNAPLWHDCFAYGILEEDYQRPASRVRSERGDSM